MKRLARFARLGLFSVILLAVAWMVLATVVAMIARHDWIPLLMYGLVMVLFIAFVRLARENRRLKEQIRELEMGLGL